VREAEENFGPSASPASPPASRGAADGSLSIGSLKGR
jgi:hypothetical protein